MGKKKKKKKRYEYDDDGLYDKEQMKKDAEALEEYIHQYDTFIISDTMSEEEYKKHMKVLKKAISDMKAGNGDAVYDRDRYEDLLQRRQLRQTYSFLNDDYEDDYEN